VKVMNRIPVWPWLQVLGAIATVIPWTTSISAPVTVVVGTGDARTDVPAVQRAVNQGGEVLLKGHFFFDSPPTVPVTAALAAAGYPSAMVLMSKSVAISGTRAEDGDMTSIEAGTIPFYVDAPGVAVRIENLRFVRPKAEAVLVYAVSGLTIASCQIKGVDPLPIFGSTAIDINTSGDIPNPNQPGHPENISGTLLIVNNDVDVAGGTAGDDTVGVAVWSVGVPGAEVQAFISGNAVTNFNEKGINIRRALGRMNVERNRLTTDTIMGPAPGASGIFAANLGSYLIAHNSVHARWATGSGFGIDVRSQSQFSQWSISGAIIVDNDVNMDAPAGTAFTVNSAGIHILGNATGNSAQDNRIHGRARAALAVAAQGGLASDNTFALNRLDDFDASFADVSVGVDVLNTQILGQKGTIDDQGTNTVIVPL
jgi:hypothetical protein